MILKRMQSYNILLFLLAICPFWIEAKTLKIHSKCLHRLFIVAFLVIYELLSWHFEVQKVYKNPLFDDGMSGAAIFAIAYLMIRSVTILALFSLATRQRHIKLLYKIKNLDLKLQEKYQFAVKHNQIRRSFLIIYISTILYEVFLYVTQVILRYHNDVQLFLFFLLYHVADIWYTTHVFYISYFGVVVRVRYELLGRRLKTVLQSKWKPIQKQFISLRRVYDHCFQIQTLIVETFGTTLLFTILYHSVVLAISVYALIKNITRNDEYIMLFVMFISWILPYLYRMVWLAHIYASVGWQVNRKH